MKKKMRFTLFKNKLHTRIRRLILLVLLITFLFVANNVVQNIVIKKFTEVEIVELDNDIKRFTEKESQIFESYQVRLLDYAEWDDAYDYINGDYDEFIDDNFWWDYLENNLGINFVMVTDIDSNILHYGAHDNEIGSIELSNFEDVDPNFMQTLIEKNNTSRPFIFLSTEQGLFILFVNSVTDNFNTYEPNGYMVFGLRMDDLILADISKQIGNNVTIVNQDIPAEVSNYFNTSDHQKTYKIIEEEHINTYMLIDSKGDSTNYFLTQWDRTIYETALSSAQFLQSTLLVSVIIMILIAFIIAYTNIKNTLILKNLTYYDHLTGVFNRRYYESIISQLGKHFNYPIIIVISDINGLKIMNDAFGHDNGDLLIKKAASFLTESLKKDGFVARLGGDEFASVFSGNSSDAEEYIANVQKMTDGINIEGIKLSLSYGYSVINNEEDTINEITRKAEDSMYRQKLQEIPTLRSNAIENILTTLNAKDTKSEEHSRRVSLYATEIAKALELPSEVMTNLITVGLVHDIGKIAINSDILKKVGKLTNDEFDIIKSHPEIGFRILNSISQLRELSKVVLSHHEHWDGNGYPQKLVGEQIPYLSRILAIADAIDAMISSREYNKTFTVDEAFTEIEKCAGTQFDPSLVKSIIKHKETLVKNIELILTKS